MLNPFDAFAVQHAAALRTGGDEVAARTRGPPQAEEALRDTLRLGADRAVHLSDRVFAVADTIGTSRTLALALRKLEAEVVVCGRKTVDAETWQVPPEVAAFLGVAHVTSVVALERRDGALRLTRETDDGEEVYEAEPPLVVSVVAGPPGAAPAPGSPDGPIDLWTATDLVDDLRPNDKRFGQPGSPTRVLAVRDVRPERAGRIAADAAEAAQLIRERLAPPESAATSWEKPERLGAPPGRNHDCPAAVQRPRRP